MQAGHDIVTAGWCSLRAGDPWTPASFELSSIALGITAAGAPGVMSLALTEVVGLDQLDDSPDGLAVLEFSMSPGAVVHARVPAGFVDEVVDALQRSRASVPPVYTEPAGTEPADTVSADAGPADAGLAADEPSPEPDLRSLAIDDPPPPPAGRSGSKSAPAAEVALLREYLDGLGFPERRALRSDVDSLIAHRTEVLAEVRAATRTLRQQEVALVRVRRESVLQDVGVYRPRHPAEDSLSLKDRLEDIHRRIDELVEAGDGVTATDDWTVNGSKAEGSKVVLDLAHLLLRTYNAEADLLVTTIRPYQLDAAVDRLTVTRATIHRLGASMEIEISEELHRLRTEELAVAADQLELDDRARRESAAPESDRGGAGFLVVTSNRGTFGEGVVRVGVTSHDDDSAVIDEVDGGRLPFRSDLHALVPAPDAGGLLASIRTALGGRRLNLTDPGCSFFTVGPAELRDLLVTLGADVTRFVVGAIAEEWHQSDNARHDHDH